MRISAAFSHLSESRLLPLTKLFFTCRKQGVSASQAAHMLFDSEKPSFMKGAE